MHTQTRGLVLLFALASCTDDVTQQQPSTTTDPGSESSGDGDGDANGDGDGDGDGEPAAECGNGIVEADEVCDDGNQDDADFCSNACTSPCAIEWLTEQADAVSGGDIGDGEITIDSGDNVIVGSQSQDAEGVLQAWIGKFDANGQGPQWEVEIPGTTGTSAVLGLAVGPDDAIYASGSMEGDDGWDIWIAGIDKDGATKWLLTHDGALDGSDDYGGDVEVVSDGVLVIGTVRDVEKDSDIWIRKLDFDGNELWTVTYSGEIAANGFSTDDGAELEVGQNGEIYATGSVYVDYQMTDTVLLAYGPDGSGPNWELHPHSGSPHVLAPTALELDDAGSVYLNIIVADSPVHTFYLDKIDLATQTELWSLSNDDLAVEDDPSDWRLNDVRANPEGLVTTGVRRNVDYKPGLVRQETWLAHFDVDGNPRCYAAHGREIADANTIAVTLGGPVALQSDGHPVVTGAVFTGEGFDRWFGRFGTP